MAWIDLNLRPAVASKALEWCRRRVEEEGDTDVEHRRRHHHHHHHNPEVLPLEEDVARLKEELRKIEPFRRDLSSIVAVVAYVIKQLEEEVAPPPPLKGSRVDGDVVSDLSIVDVAKIEDRRRIATSVTWSNSSEPRRGCDGNATLGGVTETTNNKLDQMPPSCSTALALSTPPPLAFDAQKQQQPRRHRGGKRRRCWSPELHRRFVDTLERLGGPQVATPKHIRELMEDHGLTNDEVKSHLQKHRLRVKNKSSSAQVSGNHRPPPFSDHCSTVSNEVGDVEIESSDWWRYIDNQYRTRGRARNLIAV